MFKSCSLFLYAYSFDFVENSRSFKDPLLGLSRMCGARGGLGRQAAESLEKEKEEGPATEIWTNSQTNKKKNEFFN